MVVGVIAWQLHLPGCHSLKDKRRIVKSLKDRLQQRFHVSASEVDFHEQWQRAALAAAVVSPDRRHAEEVLGSADRLVQNETQAFITHAETSFY